MTPLIFFGDASRDLPSLQKEFPDLQFLSLKQIHSDKIVASTEVAGGAVIEADALWSSRSGEALTIRTADCVPVLFYSQTPELIAAAHAGWRGIAGNIIGKTVELLCGQGADVSLMRAWIGPHIRVESFEVGTDVAEQLESIYSSLPFQGSIAVAHADPSKRFINLERIAIAQLVGAGLPLANITGGGADTLRESRYHSFRRDAAKAGRQQSFIALC